MKQLLESLSLPDSNSSRHNFAFSNSTGIGRSLLASLVLGHGEKYSPFSIVVTESDRDAQKVTKELSFFLGSAATPVLYLPDSETLPYDTESPHSGLVSDRAAVFFKIFSSIESCILVTSVSNLVTKISTHTHWKDSALSLSINTKYKNGLASLVEDLNELGYEEKELEIEDYAEFSYRNNVLDVFPIGSNFAVRIKFDGETVSFIAKLNLKKQLSESNVSNVLVLPAKEMPTNKSARHLFRKKFREVFQRGIGVSLYEDVGNGIFPFGIESYLSLFQENTTTVLEVLASKSKSKPRLFFIGDIENTYADFYRSVESRYNDLKTLENKLILEPSVIWLNSVDFNKEINNYQIIELNQGIDGAPVNIKNTNITRKESLQATLDFLENWIQFVNKIVFCLHSSVRQEQVKTIFTMLDCESDHASSWEEAIASPARLSIVKTELNEGCFLPDDEILIITEKEIFGQPIFAKSDDSESDRINNFQAVQDLVNLNIGDPIVHLKHGVGRFNGLETTEINGVTKEFMTIMYAERAKVFVQMNQLNLVSRYAGTDTEKAPLDTGSSGLKWVSATEGAQSDIIKLAKELIEIQANRKVKTGKIYKRPDHRYIKFVQEFPFQETFDQRKASQDIIDDLQNIIMDRIVCGDVGFGKTEIAMKASAYNVFNGYQVVILAPTTLLAQQHLENFRQRFSSFPDVKIEGLFGGDKSEEKLVLNRISKGSIDIVIGTHRVLQPDVEFNNLGLVIIDEEHRFGVKQKEHFRMMRKDVNLLSMTATPIPRTLSMSMHGIRDISIIATPPAKRLSIRTFLEHEEKSIIMEAVNREIRRGGQIFYLHNRTETIAGKAEQLKNIFPNLRIRYGHGKMKEHELESLMADFYRGDFDMLVATTIIETGIDCPNANTIIIESAENFGIAQLHQLRGRVGRSHHQAYCYLLRGQDIIPETAEKRLAALTKATKLGEGFVLANHDLEIRGAGEILGDEQSGQIQKIGFAIYLRLLERAIEALKNGASADDLKRALDLTQESIIDVNLSAYIEQDYIVNDRSRLSYYKRIVSAESLSEIDEIQTELTDKYGLIPLITQRFIRIFRYRILASNYDIRKMMINQDGGFVALSEGKRTSIAENMVDLVVSNHHKFRIKSTESFEFSETLETEESRFKEMDKIIRKLSEGVK